MTSLIQKYNIPCPRYTSYPTVPFWQNEELDENNWLGSIGRNLGYFKQNSTSIYIHLPFCESLCTFCGCHKRITKNHAVEKPYIDAILEEWKLYQEQFLFEIEEVHLGGGTPTFFAPSEMKRLIDGLLQNQFMDYKRCNFSFEAHPNSTTDEHLRCLNELGFTRISLGIQDYDPVVQQAIHRIQSFEQVQRVHEQARSIGYTSISHDLVYGLPKQTLDGIKKSVELTLQLLPDRVSLYSYAHVPWIKGNGQRGFDEADLPDNEEKRALYEGAKTLFLEAGYIEIGMDHFARPEDELALAFQTASLHRNFMGYTTQATNLLIGLGASAISDSWFAFAQNEKHVEDYMQRVQAGEIPLTKGHVLSKEDLIIRQHILDIMCHFKTTLPSDPVLNKQIKANLLPMEEDGLLHIEGNLIQVTPQGIPFVRNICRAFDQYLKSSNGLESGEKNLFSKVI